MNYYAVADAVVLASGADYHVPAGNALHDGRARLQHDDFLPSSGTARAYYSHRQNRHWRCKLHLLKFFYPNNNSFLKKVFGAYCSNKWNDRRSGTGRSIIRS